MKDLIRMATLCGEEVKRKEKKKEDQDRRGFLWAVASSTPLFISTSEAVNGHRDRRTCEFECWPNSTLRRLTPYPVALSPCEEMDKDELTLFS
jgi:hypothetical protein